MLVTAESHNDTLGKKTLGRGKKNQHRLQSSHTTLALEIRITLNLVGVEAGHRDDAF